MTKQEFITGAVALRKYWNWENEMSDKGIRFEGNPACELADVMLELLVEDWKDWGYDPQADINWVVNWCSSPKEVVGFARKGQWVLIETAKDLYEFIVEMSGLEWPEKIESEDWLK